MSKQSASFYNKFSFLYPAVDMFLKPQKKVLFNEINELAEGRLLEIGVGNGGHLQLYKKHSVIGIDTSAAMLEIARKNCPGNIEILEMNGEVLSFGDNEFDSVVLSHVITVVDDPERLMEEVWRVLKPQGRVFILNHFTPDNWLKYVDRAFAVISKMLHFKSFFCIDDIAAIKKFTLSKEMKLGIGGYFKILVYQKR